MIVPSLMDLIHRCLIKANILMLNGEIIAHLKWGGNMPPKIHNTGISLYYHFSISDASLPLKSITLIKLFQLKISKQFKL